MKKTFIKLMSVLLCLAMLSCCLIACGGDENGDDGEAVFVIGCTGPLTGSAASYGKSVQNGANLAIEQLNANGGLGGIEFKFEMMDDEAKAEKVTAAYDALIAKGMVVSIGSVTSGACITFAEESADDNLFFITPSASADDAIANPNGYRICFGDPDQGSYAAEALADKYTKIGVIYNTDDAYSTGLLGGFEAKMAELNKADAYVKKSFGDSTKTNFSAQVSDLKAAGCDVVFLPIYYQEASLIIAEAESIAYNVDFFGCDGMDGIVKHVADDAALSEAIKGLKYLTPIDVNSEAANVKSFVDSYKAKYGETPDQFAADAYDAVMVVYEAMKAAGVEDVTIEASDLCDKITAVLQGDFEYVGVTGTMTWNEGGAAVKAPITVTIE